MRLAERVAAASAAWIYLPDDAPRTVTDEYVVVGYPPSWELPTQVCAVASDREPEELLAEVAGVVRSWGRHRVAWWVTDGTRPEGLVAALRDAGGMVAETVSVLAFDMSRTMPEFDDLPGVQARLVMTADDAAAFGMVHSDAWGSPPPEDEQVRQWLDEAAEGKYLRAMATVDGRPAAVGGLTLVGNVARLWGAATLPEFRHRGAYRAVLHERMSVARERGATLALVKGRVNTSEPILRRCGFSAFGEERAYDMPL